MKIRVDQYTFQVIRQQDGTHIARTDDLWARGWRGLGRYWIAEDEQGHTRRYGLTLTAALQSCIQSQIRRKARPRQA